LDFYDSRNKKKLHRNPIGLVGLHSAMPVNMEAEYVSKKAICAIAVVNDETDKDHVAGNGIGTYLNAPAQLHKLNVVTLGIFHDKTKAAISPVPQ